MPDVPFFRGPNRMDWLFAVLLQTAVDWGTDADVVSVLNILGPGTVFRHADPFGIYPAATVAVTDDYVFVVSTSTKGKIQWIGNVLGSVASNVPPSHGAVSSWFGSCALNQYAATRAQVLAAAATRKVVLVGFSLGGASVTILKDMFSRSDSLDSACIAFGVPRPGTTSFADGFPGSDYAGFSVVNDVVGSVPPITWTGLGLYNYWTPFPPFVTYTHLEPGFTLFLDGSIRPGYQEQSVEDVILGLDTGLWLSYHNQPLYGRLLRSSELPEVLPDGFAGFPNAGTLDVVASRVFFFSPVPWRWAPPLPHFPEVSTMGCQAAFYIRDIGSSGLGFQEIYYFPGDDPSIPYNVALNPVGNWISLRAKFLSNSCEIYAFRCSHVGQPRKSYLKKFPLPTKGNLSPEEKINDAVSYFGYDSSHLVKRQFHFRGIPKTWIEGDALTGTGKNGQGYITGSSVAFLDTLINNGLSILAGSGGDRTRYAITGAAQTGQGSLITLTLGTAVSIPAGTMVEVLACKGAPLLQGRWLAVGSSPAGQVTLSGSQRYSTPATPGGSLFIVTPTFYAVSSIEFNSVTTKSTGRESFLQRGRRSAKLRHR